MECSICYNEINKETGKVDLSCSHPFHFSCLVKWFDKQRMAGSSETCPLCRHDVTEFEKMPDILMEDSEEESDQEGQDTSNEDTRYRMHRESNQQATAITGPVGVWRKTRYGNWVMVSQDSS